MAKRTTITTQEEAKVLREFLETKDWEAAKAVLPDVDPAALDKGWKAWAHKKAGVALEQPAPVVEKPAAKKVDPLK